MTSVRRELLRAWCGWLRQTKKTFFRTGTFRGAIMCRTSGASPWKALLILFSGIAAGMFPAHPSHAIELPVYEVFTGGKASTQFDDIDSFQNARFAFETRYWDLYRLKSARQSQDYHQTDFLISGLWRGGRFLYGLEARRNSLTLAQDNVYTDADRLRGGRTLTQGNILFGIDRSAGGVLGTSRTAVLASLGWGDAIEASFEGRFSWRERFMAYVQARTFASEIEVSEEMNGYRFPFHFPLRSELMRGECTASLGAIQCDAHGAWELSRGEGDKVMNFENFLYFRRASLGGFAGYRLVVVPGDGMLLRRLSPRSCLPGISLAFDHRTGNGDIGMNRNDTRYLSLRDVNVSDTEARLDFVLRRSFSCSAGWERLRIKHSGDSFVDVWPFSIWDAFSSKRYRLGTVDERLDMWFLMLGALAERRHFDAEIRARLDFLNDRGELRWYEREDIVYPLVLLYSSHDETLALRYAYLLQIEPALSIRTGRRITIRMSGSAMAPLGREHEPERNPGPPSPPGPREKVTRHGGLQGALTITYSY